MTSHIWGIYRSFYIKIKSTIYFYSVDDGTQRKMKRPHLANV
jgi:hypothetical protein